MEHSRTVLLVDDNDAFRSRMAHALGERGFEVRTASTVASALSLAEQESPELAIVDLRLPDTSGLELVRGLRAIDPSTQIVVLTGYGSITTALEAIRLGAVHYLTKPADADQVLRAFQGDERAPASIEHVPSLARVEWEHIQRVVADCEGNLSRAARLLGIHRRSLQRKLAKRPLPR